MTIQELEGILAKWQHRLGLQGWKISIRWAKRGELKKHCKRDEHCWGVVFWTTEMATARIVVVRSKDIEHTVCHELIHVLMEGHLSEPLPDNQLYEQSVNKLVDALLAGYKD